MKGKAGLAAVLRALAVQSEQTETTASRILGIVRDEGIKTVEAFDEAVRAAYEANGWHQRPGRPAAGDERGNVPVLVRSYVWEVRSALREGVRVSKCETFYELRQARARLKARQKSDAAEVEPVLPELAGVRVTGPKEPNGALLHDLAIVMLALPVRRRTALVHDLAKVLARHRLYDTKAIGTSNGDGDHPLFEHTFQSAGVSVTRLH